nr:cytochrome P450 81E8-like [Tanacetum cinerariifolium]
MLLTGTEAPCLAVEWAMSLLLNNPTAMEKIKKEIDTHVSSERLLQENDLDKLIYLQNVVSESLRLYPTLTMLLPHEASENMKVRGYSVPRGTILLVNLWAIHRDPAMWDKPNEFIPERFDEKRDDKYKMLPFGVGRRACPATNFGYRMLGLVLGTLIHAFEWEKIGDKEVDMTASYDTTILFVIDHRGILARQLHPECGCTVMVGQTNRFAAMAGQMIRFAAMVSAISSLPPFMVGDVVDRCLPMITLNV